MPEGRQSYPCEDHDQRIRAIHALVETMLVEVAVMKTVVNSLQKSLYGNGQPGELDRINKKIAYHDKWLYVATGAIIVMQFLSGSGLISLKSLFGK